mmetsp:Transcript_13463/g.34377  ORF Transcript_13463/g.34377 Transcript_13463/m.34377 type:complete len:215 (-) Transcript_13463:473-1117(-)
MHGAPHRHWKDRATPRGGTGRTSGHSRAALPTQPPRTERAFSHGRRLRQTRDLHGRARKWRAWLVRSPSPQQVAVPERARRCRLCARVRILSAAPRKTQNYRAAPLTRSRLAARPALPRRPPASLQPPPAAPQILPSGHKRAARRGTARTARKHVARPPCCCGAAQDARTKSRHRPRAPRRSNARTQSARLPRFLAFPPCMRIGTRGLRCGAAA